ncbi:hypothetical protein A374_18841 [Fictibacillus macauensis ZFHKF-1]|uniref:Uncharacterized protein n=1 Tax=Fictibacillus macauensis ZFHKF-1 TaxID=1196324 RepID=I8IWA9_9BACL|nr:hypothetical protein [Fictibacillus macauensis]EIT83776.1 hypothetical protein A374_18841 [Fictibacillus macauensis ZFHKF-1]
MFSTPSDDKRDDYDHLHDRLKELLAQYDEEMNSAKERYDAYISKVGSHETTAIPLNDFEPKRLELTEQLSKYLKEALDMRAQLVKAIDQAYERYEHYRVLADQEEQAVIDDINAKAKELVEKAKAAGQKVEDALEAGSKYARDKLNSLFS